MSPVIGPSQPESTCNSVDDDCDPATPDDADADSDGFTFCTSDCDDANPAVNPGLVYDMGLDDYDAYSCAVLSPDVTLEVCAGLEKSGVLAMMFASENTSSRPPSRTDGSDTLRYPRLNWLCR